MRKEVEALYLSGFWFHHLVRFFSRRLLNLKEERKKLIKFTQIEMATRKDMSSVTLQMDTIQTLKQRNQLLFISDMFRCQRLVFSDFN